MIFRYQSDDNDKGKSNHLHITLKFSQFEYSDSFSFEIFTIPFRLKPVSDGT